MAIAALRLVWRALSGPWPTLATPSHLSSDQVLLVRRRRTRPAAARNPSPPSSHSGVALAVFGRLARAC